MFKCLSVIVIEIFFRK